MKIKSKNRLVDERPEKAELKLGDIIDAAELQSIADEFFEITNVGVGIIDMEGNVFVANGWQDICTKFHRVNPETCKNCIESDTVLSKINIADTSGFKAYKCKNNLWDISTPLVIDGRQYGNIFLGQFFFDDENPDYELFRQQAEKYGFDEKDYLEALDRVPRWSKQKVESVLRFYSRLSGFISKISFRNLKINEALEERNKAEEALKNNYSLLRIAGRTARFGGWQLNLATNRVVWSDEVAEIHKMPHRYSPQLDESINFYAPEWRHKIAELVADCAEKGIPYDEELELITAKGKKIWVRTTGEPVRNENGNITWLQGAFQDISEQKRKEELLKQSEEKFRLLYENMAEGVFYQLADGRLVDINPAGLKMLGISKEQFLGRDSYHYEWKVVDEDGNLLQPEQHPSMLALTTGTEIEKTVGVFSPVNKDFNWLIVNAKPQFLDKNAKQPWQVFVTMHDITRRRMYEALNISRLHLIEFANKHSLGELLEETLNEAEKITSSEIGFFHFLSGDQKTLSLQNWSTKTKKYFCKAKAEGLHYPVSEAGVWAECIALRKPVIHNDYSSLLNRKGMPEGHASVIRELVIPIFRGNLIVAVMGVGNKPTEYNEQDIRFATKLADLAWEITDLKRAEKALKESKETAENYLNIAAGIILKLDKDGSIDLINDKGKNLLNCRKNCLIGKNWFETCIPADIRSEVKSVFNDMMLGKIANVELFENRVITCDGTEKILFWHNELLHNEQGEIIGTLSSGEDITERKNAERILRDNETRLRELNATKDKFFSIIAHDLRGPFGNVFVFSNLLAEEIETLTSTEIKQYVTLINKTVAQTMQLLDSLLDWSRLQQGRFLFNPVHVDVNKLVTEVQAELNESASTKNIDVINNIPLLITCNADENMLKTIIRNLVSNAIKFTKPGGKVEVTALQLKNMIEISVIDSGVGIATENIGKLFNIESEISTRGTANEKGTGLGLILCREFVEKHQGSIGVESKINQGSRFFFTIPG